MLILKIYKLLSVILFIFAGIPLYYGIFAWFFFISQCYHPIISCPTGHDEGSNTFGAGISLAIYYGAVLCGVLVALVVSVIGRAITPHKTYKNIFVISTVVNGILIGAALIFVIFLICCAHMK